MRMEGSRVVRRFLGKEVVSRVVGPVFLPRRTISCRNGDLDGLKLGSGHLPFHMGSERKILKSRRAREELR